MPVEGSEMSKAFTPPAKGAWQRALWPNIRESVFGGGQGAWPGLADVMGFKRPQWMQPKTGEVPTIRSQTGVDPLQLATSSVLKVGPSEIDPLMLKPLKMPVLITSPKKGDVYIPGQYKLTYPVWKNIPTETIREMFKKYAPSV